LFKDRLEIWNPGELPLSWTTEILKDIHPSVPANPLLAEPMYLAGYIERLGTGTADIVKRSKDVGLKEPEFVQSNFFKTIIWRLNQAAGQATGQVSGEVKKVVLILNGEMKRSHLQALLQINSVDFFRTQYLDCSIEEG